MSRIYHPTPMYKYGPMQKAGGAGALSGWTPANIDSNLVYWFRGDDVAGATPITQWNDKRSAADRNLTTAGNAPDQIDATVYGNSVKAIKFVAANSEYMNTTSGGIAAETNVFVVGRVITGVANGARILDSASTTYAMYWDSTAGGKLAMWPGGSTLIADDAITPGTWYVMEWFWSTAENDSLTVNNGTAKTSALNAIISGGLEVGRKSAGTDYLDAEIAEIIAIDHKVTGSERTDLMSYFNTRYGFSI